MGILSICTKTKITLAVIQAIVVYMVAAQVLRCVHYHSVHENRVPFFRSTSIKNLFSPPGTPFVMVEPVVIFGVHNCEFALR